MRPLGQTPGLVLEDNTVYFFIHLHQVNQKRVGSRGDDFVAKEERLNSASVKTDTRMRSHNRLKRSRHKACYTAFKDGNHLVVHGFKRFY